MILSEYAAEGSGFVSCRSFSATGRRIAGSAVWTDRTIMCFRRVAEYLSWCPLGSSPWSQTPVIVGPITGSSIRNGPTIRSRRATRPEHPLEITQEQHVSAYQSFLSKPPDRPRASRINRTRAYVYSVQVSSTPKRANWSFSLSCDPLEQTSRHRALRERRFPPCACSVLAGSTIPDRGSPVHSRADRRLGC